MNVKVKSYLYGILAGLSLFSLYVILMTLLNSFQGMIEQFKQLWYYMIPLVIGFGVQIGLFTFIRGSIQTQSTLVATSGGISTVSMIACCAHHLTDVVPILGITAITLFLAKYQVYFLVIGIISNVMGIFIMLRMMKKHGLWWWRPQNAQV